MTARREGPAMPDVIDPEISATEWLAQSPPQDEHEAQAAAYALIRHREQRDERIALEGLTPRERALAAAAWGCARWTILDFVRDLIGPTAATLDAEALRSALARIPRAPSFTADAVKLERHADLERAVIRDALACLPIYEGDGS